MRDLTNEEERAIRSLRRLARKWPKSLLLFSWSGTLVVMDASKEPGQPAELALVEGIPNDGGDPEGDSPAYHRRAALAGRPDGGER